MAKTVSGTRSLQPRDAESGDDGAPEQLQPLAREKQRWEETTEARATARRPLRRERFVTTSGTEIAPLYTPLDTPEQDYTRDLGFPGEYPYTRGVHPTLHRGKLWTMRLFAGFGSAQETNKRFQWLLAHGQTGLSVAFDLPTLYGYDTDHPICEGEFGKCGVAVSSLRNMETLLQGLPLDEVTTSMTINGPAAIVWAMYIAAAEKAGYPREKLGGTLQNDILKEYIAQKEYIFPPEPSLRLVTDTVEFGTKQMPLWNTISISGYHIREAGATAAQELAFTLADGFCYVEAALERGLPVDSFAPRLSFFFNAHNDLFEEVAKYRAARRIWAREMTERYGAKDERSMLLRFHTQTAGCSLTATQPENNIVRTTIQALAAVLGGTNSLHTNSMDEALALPSESAARIALRTQQIIAEESGVANTVDPLGGSYFVEALTNQIEAEAYDYFRRIDEIGGVVPAIKRNFFQRELSDSSYRYEQEINSGERTIVGVNDYTQGNEEMNIPILVMDPEGERRQIEELRALKADRDQTRWAESLALVRRTAEDGGNLMPAFIEAVSADATLGEITDVLREVFGSYAETPVV